MAKPLLALKLLAAALTAAPPPAPAGDGTVIVIVHFHPSPGREDELKTRLLRLRDFVNAHAPGVTYRLYR